MNFIGRKAELSALRGLFLNRSASLVIIKGRRRIGKSRLIKEFGKDFTYYEFSGIPPHSKTTAQSERDMPLVAERTIYSSLSRPQAP